jgi:hypothetical protein
VKITITIEPAPFPKADLVSVLMSVNADILKGLQDPWHGGGTVSWTTHGSDGRREHEYTYEWEMEQ